MNGVSAVIRENYGRVGQRIQAACARCGRSPSEVTLIAVTKYAQLEWVRAVAELGVGDFGESHVQQLELRAPLFGQDVRWHMIGHLQRNKARRAILLAHSIHSVDTLRLLSRLDVLAGELDRRPRALLEVNVSGEESKHGFAANEIVSRWSTISRCEHLRIDGLMTMAPDSENAETTRPVFRALRELRDRLREMPPRELLLPDLSMGMSSDFEVAIEEGATMIRVGGSLFHGLDSD